MNSFLQTLYHFSPFAKKVFEIPVEENSEISNFQMVNALQEIFHELYYSEKAVSTTNLIKSFGWETSREAWVQHDVQEFKCVLLDALEEKMNECLSLKGEIYKFFGGEQSNYIECIDVICKSERKEKFYDIILNVRNSKNLMDSLRQFVQEELLEGENMYASEDFGKQKAKKGTKFISLPPMLIFQLKRFEYDSLKEENIKVTDLFEYENFIDLSEFLDSKNKECTKYKLFSVLVHSGTGSTSGHYYAFIRLRDSWYKFNDETVELAHDNQVFDANFGGEYEDANYKKNSKTLEFTNHKSTTTAYMLFYVNCDFPFQEISKNDIPQRIRDQYLENIKKEEEKKRKSEYIKVYITSWEQLKVYEPGPGLIFKPCGEYDENFKTSFIKNSSLRYKIKVLKSINIQEMENLLQNLFNLPEKSFILYKISWQNSTKLSYERCQCLSKNLLQGITNFKLVYLGAKSSLTVPIVLIMPLNKKTIFFKKPNEDSSICEIDNNNKNNVIVLDSDEEKNNEKIYEIKNDPFEKLNLEHNSKNYLKIYRNKCLNNIEINENNERIYKEIAKEERLLIFFKIYEFKNEKSSLTIFDYNFYEKKIIMSTIINEIIKEHSAKFLFHEYEIDFFKEKNEGDLDPLNLKVSVNENFDQNGGIIVFELKKKSEIKNL